MAAICETKEDFQSLGEASQKSFDEIKECMAKDHAAVINSLGKTIRDQQQIIENMESKNYRQSCVLACLNQERDETARELMAKDQLIIQRDQKILQERDETAMELKAKDTKFRKLRSQSKLLGQWSCQHGGNDHRDVAGDQEAAHQPALIFANCSVARL